MSATGSSAKNGSRCLLQPPLVVLLRSGSQLGLAGRPPARRELVERLTADRRRLRRRRRLPDAGADLGEDVLELALGLSVVQPSVSVPRVRTWRLPFTRNRRLYVTWPSLRSCTRISPRARFSTGTSLGARSARLRRRPAGRARRVYVPRRSWLAVVLESARSLDPSHAAADSSAPTDVVEVVARR